MEPSRRSSHDHPSSSNIATSADTNNNSLNEPTSDRAKRKRQIKKARRIIRELLLENQAYVADEQVESLLQDISASFGQEEMELTRWELTHLIRNREAVRREELDYEHEFDGAFFAVGDQEAWQEEDALADTVRAVTQPSTPSTRLDPQRQRRPKLRNRHHINPYHLVSDPSPLDPDSDLGTDASADPTTPFVGSEPLHFCRICLTDDFEHNLFTPCKCTGSTRYVHPHCLLRWRKTSSQPLAKIQCEICKAYYKFKGHPFSFGWLALHERVNTKNATRLCWALMILYHLFLQYVVKALLDLIPGGFVDGTTGIHRDDTNVWLFFPIFVILTALRVTHHHLKHIPVTLFLLGAFKNLPDEVMTGYCVVHVLFATLAYVFTSFQVFSDILWLAVLWYGLPTLYLETKAKVASVAQGLVRVWMEIGTSVGDEVLNYPR